MKFILLNGNEGFLKVIKSHWDYLDPIWILISFFLGVVAARIDNWWTKRTTLKSQKRYCYSVIEEIKSNLINYQLNIQEQITLAEDLFNEKTDLYVDVSLRSAMPSVNTELIDALPIHVWKETLDSENGIQKYNSIKIAGAINACKKNLAIIEKFISNYENINDSLIEKYNGLSNSMFKNLDRIEKSIEGTMNHDLKSSLVKVRQFIRDGFKEDARNFSKLFSCYDRVLDEMGGQMSYTGELGELLNNLKYNLLDMQVVISEYREGFGTYAKKLKQFDEIITEALLPKLVMVYESKA